MHDSIVVYLRPECELPQLYTKPCNLESGYRCFAENTVRILHETRNCAVRRVRPLPGENV